MFLLDTNIVIAFLKGEPIISEKVLSQIDHVALSSLVVAELDYGAKASQNSIKNLEKLYSFISLTEVIVFDLECAKTFGTIKSKLRVFGKPTGEVDALLAVTAIAHNAALVTKNRKHFENIEGLKLEVW
ncbi:MAG: type II toxin-antitoxin system VapC family toxin [bacterium]